MKSAIAIALVALMGWGLAASAQILGEPRPVTQDQWLETMSRLRNAQDDILLLQDRVLMLEDEVTNLRRRVR